jgi:hypothetical protein
LIIQLKTMRVLVVVVLLVALQGVVLAWFDESGYAYTPHHQVHKDCVYQVESGSQISRTFNGDYEVLDRHGRIQRYSACPHPRIHGRAWKAWTQYHNLDGFTFMSANWPTPPAPAQPSSSEILYYWPGTEPDDNSFVLQPVVSFSLRSHRCTVTLL